MDDVEPGAKSKDFAEQIVAGAVDEETRPIGVSPPQRAVGR
jgi:hypothetical protein